MRPHRHEAHFLSSRSPSPPLERLSALSVFFGNGDCCLRVLPRPISRWRHYSLPVNLRERGPLSHFSTLPSSRTPHTSGAPSVIDDGVTTPMCSSPGSAEAQRPRNQPPLSFAPIERITFSTDLDDTGLLSKPSSGTARVWSLSL